MWFLTSIFGKASNEVTASTGLRESTGKRLKLVIVEEHHEALLAWREALADGGISGDSTLFYIDGHAGDILPDMTSHFPLFRLPKNDQEIEHMMQANDKFIVGAKIAHLIDRAIWVYPSWLKDVPYINYAVDIGVTKHRGETAFCLCDNMDDSYECHVNDRENPESMFRIPVLLCDLQRETQSEIIRDTIARQRLLSDKAWLGSEQLILDIDEDFFGVQHIGSVMTDAGINFEHDVITLSEAVETITCPLIFQHEADGDRWFSSIVDAVILNCARDRISRSPWCGESATVVQKYFDPFYVANKNLTVICQASNSKNDFSDDSAAFFQIWTILAKYTQEQLQLFRRVGVCMKSSMRTLDTKPKLQLCTGFNKPKHGNLMQHNPSAEELNHHFEIFESILRRLPTKPRIITLARSSRGGYVPRPLQDEIERRIVDILVKMFEIREGDIIYDSLLLNGKRGDWYNRYHL